MPYAHPVKRLGSLRCQTAAVAEYQGRQYGPMIANDAEITQLSATAM